MNIRRIITALAAAFCTWTLQAQNAVVTREYWHTGHEADAFSITPDPLRTPTPVNVTRAGTIGTWKGISLVGSGNYQEYPFMMVSRNASFALGKSWGALSASAGASATNYAFMPMGTMNQFGVSAMVSYAFNDRVSVTAFGRYYSSNPFVSMAAYGAINTSSYGGYVTYMGDRVGVDVGAQRYFDPMSGRWEMAPIVTPKVKFWDSVTVEIPVGGAIKNAVEQHNMRRNVPPPPPPPGRR